MTIQAIADEHAIRNLVHRYADAASRRDPQGIASTFTAHGEWQAPELGRHKGRDAMIAFFTSMLDGWNIFLQGLQSPSRASTTTSTGAKPERGSSTTAGTTRCCEASTAP
jgi:hypothetical protein